MCAGALAGGCTTFRDYQSSRNAKDLHLLPLDHIGLVAVGPPQFRAEPGPGSRLDHVGLRSGTHGLEQGRNLAWLKATFRWMRPAVEHAIEYAAQRHSSFDSYGALGSRRREHVPRSQKSALPGRCRRRFLRARCRYRKSLCGRKLFTNPATPVWAATWLCSNTVNDTPVINKQNGINFHHQ